MIFTGRSFKSQYSFQLCNWPGGRQWSWVPRPPRRIVSPAAKLRLRWLIHIYTRFSRLRQSMSVVSTAEEDWRSWRSDNRKDPSVFKGLEMASKGKRPSAPAHTWLGFSENTSVEILILGLPEEATVLPTHADIPSRQFGHFDYFGQTEDTSQSTIF